MKISGRCQAQLNKIVCISILSIMDEPGHYTKQAASIIHQVLSPATKAETNGCP